MKLMRVVGAVASATAAFAATGCGSEPVGEPATGRWCLPAGGALRPFLSSGFGRLARQRGKPRDRAVREYAGAELQIHTEGGRQLPDPKQ